MAICSDRLSKKKEETLVDPPSNLEVRDYSCVQPSWATPPCGAECSSVPPRDRLFQASHGLEGLPNNLRWWDALWRGIWHLLTAKENFRVERNDHNRLWFYPTADKFTNFHLFIFSLLFHCPMSRGPDERERRNPLFVILGKTRESIFRRVTITGYNWDNAGWAPSLRGGEKGMAHQREGWGKRCPVLAPCGSLINTYLSKILCGCIRLLTTWVRWSWVATTSGGGLYLFTAATFSRIRNAKGKQTAFLKRRLRFFFNEIF